MPRFNPFAHVDCSRGAPFGRDTGDAISKWDGKSRLYARWGGGDGSYDRGGAYWGHSDIYAVWTRGGDFCVYIDGVNSPEAAIEKVKRLWNEENAG